MKYSAKQNMALHIAILAVILQLQPSIVARSIADGSNGISQSVSNFAPPFSQDDVQHASASLDGFHKAESYIKLRDESIETGNWDQAYEFEAKAEEFQPSVHGMDILRAQQAMELKDYSGALASYNLINTSSRIVNDGWAAPTTELDTFDYAFVLMNAGETTRALQVYTVAREKLGDNIWLNNGDQSPVIPSYTSQNPPFSAAEFESMAMVGAAVQDAARAVPTFIPMTCDANGKEIPLSDPNYLTYHKRVILNRFKLAVDLNPTSPVPYYYLGEYYLQFPGDEKQSADAFHKAWENADETTEKLILSKDLFTTNAFKKAFDARFSDIPH